MRTLCLSAICCVLVLARTSAAQEKPLAFVGATILPIAGEPIDNGTLVVRTGKIVAVGARDDIELPDGAQVIDAKGKTIMPGLVDTHSHIGGWGGGDKSSPIAPETRILDAINVRSSGFRRAAAGGITSINIMPGSGHLISGQTVYIKNRNANTIDKMLIRDGAGNGMGGLKMANGTNPQKAGGSFPGTRGKAAAMVREQFVKAQAYKRKRDEAKANPDKQPPDRDLAMEALVEALEGKRIVHHHTHRHDDIITVLRLKKEFGFRVVLHHVTEGWKVPGEIAEAGVPCSVIVVDSPGGKLEVIHKRFENGAILEKAGVDIAYHTDDWITDSRYFLRSAALGVRGGMSRSKALESVTIAGARMLDIADRTGTLETGKDADFIILSGDPLSIYTKVLETWVEGEKVFDRANEKDRLYAVGGFGATHDQTFYLCCQGAGGHE